MIQTPAVCDVEQAERIDLQVISCVYMAAEGGRTADTICVRDLLVMQGMTADRAARAIEEAAVRGLVRFAG